MSKVTKTKTSRKSSTKGMTFAALRVKYAEAKGLDVTIASKRLRSKLRGAYAKDPVIKGYIDRKGKNADGNRYPDPTAKEAKAILAL